MSGVGALCAIAHYRASLLYYTRATMMKLEPMSSGLISNFQGYFMAGQILFILCC